VNYREWEVGVPEEIKGDSLWRMKAYRQGLFLADIGWRDVTRLTKDRRTQALSDQLYRALGDKPGPDHLLQNIPLPAP
jgi:hypothetical protein